MLLFWTISGLASWVILWLYRFKTQGRPKNLPLIAYVRGFIGCLLFGPLCIPFAYLAEKGYL